MSSVDDIPEVEFTFKFWGFMQYLLFLFVLTSAEGKLLKFLNVVLENRMRGCAHAFNMLSFARV